MRYEIGQTSAIGSEKDLSHSKNGPKETILSRKSRMELREILIGIEYALFHNLKQNISVIETLLREAFVRIESARDLIQEFTHSTVVELKKEPNGEILATGYVVSDTNDPRIRLLGTEGLDPKNFFNLEREIGKNPFPVYVRRVVEKSEEISKTKAA